MGRWEPGALGRLHQAAMELYVERGFEQTTVAEIAARAGLTERTFFRHFADKREVLFAGSGMLSQLLTEAIAAAPADATPLEATAAALYAFAGVMANTPEHSRARQGLMNANPELMERELIKLAKLAADMSLALQERGVAEPAASLTAEAGMAVFRVAFMQWTDPASPISKTPPLKQLIASALDELKSITR